MIDVEYFLAGFWSLDWLWKKGKTGFVVAGVVVVVALLVYTVGKIMYREDQVFNFRCGAKNYTLYSSAFFML